MAVISGYNSSSISALFAGLNSGNSSSSFGIGSIDLSTYNSIRTGTYKQLLKSYYAKNPVKDSSKTDSGSTTTISSQKINAAKTKDAASAVVDDAQNLKSVSLWNKSQLRMKMEQHLTNMIRMLYIRQYHHLLKIIIH